MVEMKIVNRRPPNYEQIRKVFPLSAGEGTIFAYGDTIYFPAGGELPPELLAHEEAHGVRQREIGVEEWWKRYLEDDGFRYEEELIAHKAELAELCRLFPTRQQRRYFLRHVAKRLTAALYAYNITMDQAVADLRS